MTKLTIGAFRDGQTNPNYRMVLLIRNSKPFDGCSRFVLRVTADLPQKTNVEENGCLIFISI